MIIVNLDLFMSAALPPLTPTTPLRPFVAADHRPQTSALSGSDDGGLAGATLASSERRSTYSHHRLVFLAGLGDALVILAALLLAFWVRFSLLDSVGRFNPAEVRTYVGHMLLGTVSLLGLLAWLGVYRREMLLQRGRVLRRVAKGCAIWSAGFLTFALVFETQPPISRLYMALAGLSCWFFLTLWRAALHRVLVRPSVLVSLQHRTIVVGSAAEVAELGERLVSTKDVTSRIVGWVTSKESEGVRTVHGVPCLGRVDDLSTVLETQVADMVILTDMGGSSERAMKVASACEREMVSFKIIPSCFRIFVSGLQLEAVAGTPVIGVGRLPLDSSFNVLLKRCFDLLGGLVGLLMSAPLIGFFSFMVWWESKGSVIYRQVRTGADGRDFTIYKIRSMRLDAESNGAQWCKADDPRRLRVGAFMRKWNIDELPQFWNVLRGEMSLVGPRPERPELIDGFKHSIPHYNARHHALPGMTGWAQVMGLRGDTDLAARIRADIWYLENWSLILDFKIMLMTFFKRDNAY
jgi:exopolysaccharide biosynthesis polyprenyl glycosylphosphotransferase